MDTLTHVFLIYVFVAIFFKITDLPRSFLKPLLIGIIIPDLDYFFKLIGVSATWLTHRGMFHSIFALIPLAFIVASILFIPKIKTFVWKWTVMRFWVCAMFIYIGGFLHIMMDLFLPTGMMILFPFSFKMFQPIDFQLCYIYAFVIGLILGFNLLLYLNQNVEQISGASYSRPSHIFGMVAVVVLYGLTLVWFFLSQTEYFILASATLSFISLEIIMMLKLRSDMKIGQ